MITEVNDSKFNMWRACIAAVHLDNKVTNEERKWVEEKIQKLPLTPSQRDILKDDLEHGKKFEEAYQKITDKVDLAFLLNTLRVIGYLDKDFSAVENANFKKLEAIILKGLNLPEITAQIEALELQSYHESEVYKDNNPSSKIEHVYHSFMKWINPGDYKFPSKK